MNKNQKVTLKEVAHRLNVSVGTIHRAIYNKKGVSEETRQLIIKTVKDMNYEVNVIASSLKRKRIKVAIVLPEPVKYEKYFYQYLWKGVDDAIIQLGDYGLELNRICFGGTYEEQVQILKNIYEKREIDGLLTIALHETAINSLINDFTYSEIPVVLVNTDAPESKRLTCVAPPSLKMGELAGELMGEIINGPGKVIILGGAKEIKSNHDRILGFNKVIVENYQDIELIEIYDLYSGNNKLNNMLKEFIENFNDIKGIYSSNSRNTLLACRLIEELNKSSKIKVIGTDLFDESIEYLKNKTLNAIIYQNPYIQAKRALKILVEYIIKRQSIPLNIVTEINVVLKSNLDFFI